MCFNIAENFPKPLVAKRNITVYKSTFVDPVSVREDKKGNFLSTWQSYVYKPEELQPKVKLKKERNDFYDGSIINQGYHSFTSLPKWHGTEIIYGVFVIPKGTKYYVDPFGGERVSETIIYKGKYKK